MWNTPKHARSEGPPLLRCVRITASCLAIAAVGGAAPAQPPAPDPVLAAPAPAGPFAGQKVVRVQPATLRDMRTALALTDDVWTCGFGGEATSPDLRPASIDIRLTPAAFDALRASRIPFTILIDDLQARVDAEQAHLHPPFDPRGPGFYSDYHNLANISSYCDSLVASRPTMASRLTVGTSVEGRQIFALRISAPGAAPGSRPAVVIYGCQHAREWITPAACVYVADQLIHTYDTDLAPKGVHRLLDNLEFYIIPVVNVDGYFFTWDDPQNRLWRKNRRSNGDGTMGVDLNRNWGEHWGGPGSSGNTSSDIYRGPTPFSEPETQALRDFITARPNTVLSFDVHNYSQLVLEPWAYTSALPPDTRAFTQLTAAILNGFSAPNGEFYIGGETYRTIYPAAGGSHDWVFGARSVLAYGVELRDRGTNAFLLPASQIVPASAEALGGVTAAANWVLDNAAVAYFPAGRPSWVAANSATAVTVQFARGIKALADPTAPGRTPILYSRIGRNAPFTATPVNLAGADEGGAVFTHALTAGPCAGVVQWYYALPQAGGATLFLPPGGASSAYEAAVRTGVPIFSDDFEVDRGWTVGDPNPTSPDTATSGLWTRIDPNGTPAQPEYDTTPLGGTFCYATGQNPTGDIATGRLGVGKSTLLSPIFSAAGAPIVEASFSLWTYTDGVETFAVDASASAATLSPVWTRVLTIGPSSPNALTSGRWTRYTLRLTDSLIPSTGMRLRFVATSTTGAAVMEAAVDDVSIFGFTCARGGAVCPGDYNADGVRSVQDLFDFLADWFAHAPRADVNGVGGITVQDLFDFLAAWFTGC